MTVSNMTEKLVSSLDMYEIPGMTRSRLERWCKAGYLVPQSTGKLRWFHPRERDVARVMVALVEAGVSQEAACRAARNGGWLAPSVRVVFGSGEKKWVSVGNLY